MNQLYLIDSAIAHLKQARDALRKAQAPRAADYVAHALKSTEGARRHAINHPIDIGIFADNRQMDLQDRKDLMNYYSQTDD